MLNDLCLTIVIDTKMTHTELFTVLKFCANITMDQPTWEEVGIMLQYCQLSQYDIWGKLYTLIRSFHSHSYSYRWATVSINNEPRDKKPNSIYPLPHPSVIPHIIDVMRDLLDPPQAYLFYRTILQYNNNQ